jgi:PH domain
MNPTVSRDHYRQPPQSLHVRRQSAPIQQQQQQQTRSRQSRPQQEYETPLAKRRDVPVIRKTPPSAQHYTSSTASVSRQQQFRRQQQEYFPQLQHQQQQQQHVPKIGLDYVNDGNSETLRTPSPLVLDPSAPTPPSAPEAKPGGMMQHLLKGIGVSGSSSSMQSPSRNRQHYSHTSSPYRGMHEDDQQPTHNNSPRPPTATDLARLAPKAGFLQKLGSNIHTYKRRFFVLQPSTYLYYFLSPNDTVPRGAIAMDDATSIDIVQEMPDGSCRLTLSWPNGKSIHLEARNREVAEEWCSSLQQERLGHARAQYEESQQHLAAAHCEIDDLKRQLEQFRLIEEDRDGALEDARKWKEQFEELDESIRLLANHVRKMPTEKDEKEKDSGKLDAPATHRANPNDKAKTDVERAGTPIVEVQVRDIEGDTQQPNKENNNLTTTKVPSDSAELDDSTTEKATKTIEAQEDVTGEVPAVDNGNNDTNDDVNASRRDVSLLDDDAAAEEAASALFESSNIIEQLLAPGQHFPALLNACQQLRENLRLASEEATSAVEDTKVAQEVTKALQARMTKAEKQLCSLWEENCSIRRTLKQKKREKRVLVREVKSLMELQQRQHQQHVGQERLVGGKLRVDFALGGGGEREDDASTIIGSDEERLINELEEHVVSSIRLHEKFVAASSAVKGTLPAEEPRSKPKVLEELAGPPSSSSTATTTSSTQSGLRNHLFARQETTSTAATAVVRHTSTEPSLARSPSSRRVAPLPSLFDRSSFLSDSEDEEDVDSNAHTEAVQAPADDIGLCVEPPRLVSSLGVVDGHGRPKPVETDGRSISSVVASVGGDSASSEEMSYSTPLRPNPLLQLDLADVEETQEGYLVEDKCFKPISIAQFGQATSRLVCPLADVVQTRPRALTKQERVSVVEAHQDELQIYHLTFYTPKIGLQFQKVPAPQAKPRGLLTDAMTADLAGDPRGSSKTASELKRVAAISTWAKDDAHKSDSASFLQVAAPVDAVLVCGFVGFDDSGNNQRPKLGARLVAFDGVSVEQGRWTFDSIRKSIQARGRPLTLSFRNDFLTTDQRAIITKAVSQGVKRHPPVTSAVYSYHGPTIDSLHHSIPVSHHQRQVDYEVRPDSRASAPSLPPVSSHETDQFVNETFRTTNVIKLHEPGHPKRWEDDDDDLTVSTTGYYSDSHQQQHRRRTSSSVGSYTSRGPSGFAPSYRSFSEAGSSASALSAAIGPLMSNLLAGLSAEKKKPVNMNPSYLHSRIPVESTPQHQEFQAGLL